MQLSKKEKKKLIRKLQKEFDYKYVHYTFDNDTVSLSGFYPFLVNFMNLLGLKDLLNDQVQLNRKGRLYSNMDMFHTLVDSLIFDIERVENIGLLNHTLCQKIRELKNIPDAQTARDYLETFTLENVHELLQANKEILSRVQEIVGPQEVTLLSDTHVTTAYGQQEQVEVGYNPKKHGRPSFQSKVAFLHDTGWLINFQLCGGKSTSKTHFQSFFEQTESLLPKGCWLSRVRLDRGFFSEETCLFFEAKETLTYYLKVVVNPCMKSHFAQIPEEDFTHVEGTPFDLAVTYYRPDSWQKDRRFIVIRKTISLKPKDTKQKSLFELPPVYQYEAIVTNADDNETKEDIFDSYNSGCQVENFIKELSYEFYIDKINSQEFTANYAFMTIKCITYNIAQCFKQFILKDAWKKSSFKTIKNYLVKIPGNVFKCGKGIRRSIPSSYKFKDLSRTIEERLFLFAQCFL